MGTRVAKQVWTGPRLRPASLADAEGNPEKPIFAEQTPKYGARYVYIIKSGHSRMDFRKWGPMHACQQSK